MTTRRTFVVRAATADEAVEIAKLLARDEGLRVKTLASVGVIDGHNWRVTLAVAVPEVAQ